MALLHFVLFVCDSAFVEAAVDHPAVVVASAVLKVLRLVDQVAVERDGPLIMSCSIPAVTVLRYDIKFILRVILHQLKLPWRRHVVVCCACFSAAIRSWSALAVAGPVQAVLLV